MTKLNNRDDDWNDSKRTYLCEYCGVYKTDHYFEEDRGFLYPEYFPGEEGVCCDNCYKIREIEFEIQCLREIVKGTDK